MFHLPIEEAAKQLGIGQTMLKHYCRKFGIPRWPYRKRQSLVILISSIQEFAKDRPEAVEPALAKLRSFLAQVRMAAATTAAVWERGLCCIAPLGDGGSAGFGAASQTSQSACVCFWACSPKAWW